MAFSISKFSEKLMYLYLALSKAIQMVWQFTSFALNLTKTALVSAQKCLLGPVVKSSLLGSSPKNSKDLGPIFILRQMRKFDRI